MNGRHEHDVGIPRFVAPDKLLFARNGDVMVARFDPGQPAVTGDPVTVVRGVENLTFINQQFAVSAAGKAGPPQIRAIFLRL